MPATAAPTYTNVHCSVAACIMIHLQNNILASDAILNTLLLNKNSSSKIKVHKFLSQKMCKNSWTQTLTARPHIITGKTTTTMHA